MSLIYNDSEVIFSFMGIKIYKKKLKEDITAKKSEEKYAEIHNIEEFLDKEKIEIKEDNESESMDNNDEEVNIESKESENFGHNETIFPADKEWDDVFEDFEDEDDNIENKEKFREKINNFLKKIKIYQKKYLRAKEFANQKYKRHKFLLKKIYRNLKKILWGFRVKGIVEYGSSDMEMMGKLAAAYYGTKVLNKNFDFLPKFYDSDIYFQGDLKFFISHMRILWTLCIIFIIMIKEWKLIRGLLKK